MESVLKQNVNVNIYNCGISAAIEQLINFRWISRLFQLENNVQIWANNGQKHTK